MPDRARVGFVVISLALVAAFVAGCGGSTGVRKTGLDGKPAPDFSLVDQQGQRVTLAGWRGRAVALTFLYTSCPDVCPIATTTFGQAHDLLGKDQQKAQFAVISVDPERDTVQRVKQYVDGQRLSHKLQFLTGDRASLEPVWSAYRVSVVKGKVKPGDGGAPDFYEVDHQNVVYLLDREGRQRALIFGFEFTAEGLAAELRSLMN